MLEHHLLFGDARERLEKLVYRLAVPRVLKQRPDRDPNALENPSATTLLRVAFYGCTT